MGSEGKLGRGLCLPTKYASRMTSAAEMTMALRAAHFQLQYLEGFLRLKAGRAKVLRGSGRGGGEYTVLEVRGYPGDVVQKSGEVPPGLKRKCLWMERSQRASGSAGSPGTQVNLEDRDRSRRSMHRSLERESVTTEKMGEQEKGESRTRSQNRAHEDTFPRNTDRTALPKGKATHAKAEGATYSTEGWVLRSFSWEGMGLEE